MLGDAICVKHTQNPQAEPSKLRFMNLLLGLVSVYQLLGLGLVSGANGLLGLGISLARASKTLLGLGLNPLNRDRALSTLGSFCRPVCKKRLQIDKSVWIQHVPTEIMTADS